MHNRRGTRNLSRKKLGRETAQTIATLFQAYSSQTNPACGAPAGSKDSNIAFNNSYVTIFSASTELALNCGSLFMQFARKSNVWKDER
jgi:hypothetical protein